MEKSQDYSFNKSHAACYALIAYRTAWLRANHPCEYMAALISLGDEHEGPRAVLRQRVPRARDRGAAARRERVADRLRRRRRQDPLRPQRREGRGRGRVPRDRRARARRAARSSRSGTSPSASTRRSRTSASLEALVKCGALPGSRKGMLEVLEQALGWRPEAAGRPARRPGVDLRPRRRATRTTREAPPADRRPTSSRSTSCCALEKEVLGLYVSEHPLSAIRDQLRRKTDATIAELERRRDGEVVTVGGIVSAVKQHDDEARRADGVPAPRRRHRRHRVRRLQLDLRAARASSASPTAS